METLTWITATTYWGTSAICAEASAASTVERFLRRAEARGAIVNWVKRPADRDWDGGRLTDAQRRRLQDGLRRNA